LSVRGIQRFAAKQPLAFVLLATLAWIMGAGVIAFVTARLLHTSISGSRPQSLGSLTATACLVLVMWRWGWLRAAGVAKLGSWRLWLVTAGLTGFVVVAYQLAFFGEFPLNISTLRQTGEAQTILVRQAVVGITEETLFRGFLLYALVRVWGNTRRGMLAAIVVPALIFGLVHILQALSGNPIEDTLMTILNGLVGGLWLGALVLLGGSIWPAVLIHAAGNATVQLGALIVSTFDPGVANFAVATAAELPLVIVGLWLLLRKEPGAALVGKGE
jgi:membrane protease YdiL (CAAX protease family)